jgi:hypothetical protein
MSDKQKPQAQKPQQPVKVVPKSVGQQIRRYGSIGGLRVA